MSSRKGHTEPFVRCYEVGSPTLHQDGYTVYKVTEQVCSRRVGHAHFVLWRLVFFKQGTD